MGPWSGLASEWLGVPIDVRPLKGQIIRLRAPGPPYMSSIGWNGQYATTKPDGLVWAGTTEEEVGFDETTTSQARDEIMATLLKMVPGLGDARLVLQTACLRPMATDKLLVLGEIPGWERVYIATGGGRGGILLGPAMGRTIADLVATGVTDMPIDDFDPGRFRGQAA
jgi:glycine/D-amino acid oxidase-like deaminating enzyme